jgi:hypothetical protein
MNVVFRRFSAALLAAVLIGSCSSKRSTIALNTQAIEADALVTLVGAAARNVQSLAGKGSITFESPEIAGSAAFEMSMRKPDSLLVTLEGPFGISVGTFFLSRERYIMYNSLENSVISGVPTTAAIRSIVPFEMSYDQILDAFSGAFAPPNGSGELVSYSVDNNSFLLVFNCGGMVCRYWIDNEDLVVTRFEQLDEQGRLAIEAIASSFTERNGAYAPKRIVVKFPQQERRLAVYYSSLVLNPPDPSFAFSIPKNARTIIR